MDPWFKFYAADYLLDEDVDMLPLEAQGILVRLWCLCWRSTSIPDAPDLLAKRTKVDPKIMKRHWDRLRVFFCEVEGGLQSNRLERERTESRAKSEGHRFGAQKTNEKRWGKRSLSDSPSDNEPTSEAIAKRITQRVAEVSPSESESDTEKNNPLPPTASPSGEDVKSRKPSWQKAHPPEVVKATQEIKALWPTPTADQFQPDGKTLVPGVSSSELACRLADIQHQGADLDVCVKIARRVVSEWQAGKWIKAPQHFFGKAKDAPFRAYYQAHVTTVALREVS
jgi:uncharacterized protein YdaU (DUF1376 family)